MSDQGTHPDSEPGLDTLPGDIIPPRPRVARPGLETLVRIEEACTRWLEGRSPSESAAPGLPARQLGRLLDISRAMNRIHVRSELLEYVGERLRELFDADNNFVILFEEDGSPRVISSNGSSLGDDVDGHAPSGLVSNTILEQVRTTREALIIDDTADQPGLQSRQSIRTLKITSVMCAPLLVGDRVIGALQFDQRGEPEPFTERDLELLSLFADQVATALNNLELIEWLNGTVEEMRAAQEYMIQSERLAALGEMAAAIAHDFNNALFVALGACDVLLTRTDLATDVIAQLATIRTCALDAANTVRRLQSSVRGSSTPDQPEPLDVRGVLEEMSHFTRHKWNDEALRRGVSIRIETDLEGSPLILASASELREVLTNLIFNAVDAMQTSGKIVLRARQLGERVLVSVQDEGVGMNEATRAQIFQPFFSTKGVRGSGFGLSTCWSIVQRLSGEIDVESTPGEGSTFTLALPAAESSSSPEPAQPLEVRRTLKVLVVDDDGPVLDTVVGLLKALGHSAFAVTDGWRALDLLGRETFDVVLTDFGMPEITGAGLAREISTTHPGLPVLLLTGWGSDLDLDSGELVGVTRVLAKPVTLAALRQALNEVVE